MLPQLDANLTDDVEKSIFWGPVTRMPQEFSAADREAFTAAFRTTVRTTPAYRKLRTFIADGPPSAATPFGRVRRRAPPGTNTTCATTPCVR